MFEKQEAFDFVKNFLQVENAESRMEIDKRELLNEIIYKIHTKIPFQNISLLSVPPNERGKPSQDMIKKNYISGIGGLCFDNNISTFHLLSALGFEVTMVHCTVSTAVIFKDNHVTLIVRNLVQKGDKFLLDVSSGTPTFESINLNFEKESPIYVNTYLEYKFIKQEGRLLRMHRKGDPLVARGVQKNSEIEFWIDGWRRFYDVDLSVETKDPTKFDKLHKIIYVNPKASPFHLSHRFVLFPDGKAAMVVNDKTYTEIDNELVITPLEGGDEAIKSKIKEICPNFPEDLIPKSLLHWRQSAASN